MLNWKMNMNILVFGLSLFWVNSSSIVKPNDHALRHDLRMIILCFSGWTSVQRVTWAIPQICLYDKWPKNTAEYFSMQSQTFGLHRLIMKAESIEIALPKMLSYSPSTGLGCPLFPVQKLWVNISFIEHRSFHVVHQCSRWFLASSYVLHSSSGNTVMSAYDDLENELVLLLYFLFLFSVNSGRWALCEKNFRLSHTILLLFKHVQLISH